MCDLVHVKPTFWIQDILHKRLLAQVFLLLCKKSFVQNVLLPTFFNLTFTGDVNCLCGATAKQGVFIWDISKEKIIKRFTEVSELDDLISNKVQGSLESRKVPLAPFDSRLCMLFLII